MKNDRDDLLSMFIFLVLLGVIALLIAIYCNQIDIKRDMYAIKSQVLSSRVELVKNE